MIGTKRPLLGLLAVLAMSPTLRSGESLSALRSDFRDPPFEYGTRPLWFWNGPLSADETKVIMERSKESGYAGFGILPSRGMTPAFMTAEFLSQYRVAVETAAALGQTMCLYDEYFFPSGYAGGLLKERYPEAVAKRLDREVLEVTGPSDVSQPLPPGAFQGAVAVRKDTLERVDISSAARGGRIVWKAPAGPWSVQVYTCVPDGTQGKGLVDYLDPKAVGRFVELTYEKYHAAFPEHFGTTIDSAFYDEPTFHWVEGGRAWTEAFNEEFEKEHGYSPVPLYPALWDDIGPDTAAARNALFGFRAELFSRSFPKVLNDWCRAHSIELTGHVDQEEIVNPVGLCGDLMKAFRHQDIPGIDQIFQYGRASKAYKVVSSAAYNYDRRLVMTECYGAIRGMPLAGLYKEAMDQFAKGINVMVPHAVWYSSSNITFEPELSYKSPVYGPALPAYNAYMRRLQRVLQHGRHVADIAVLYPIATLQAGYRFGVGVPYQGGIVPEEADYMDVGEMLALGVRRDFTFVHPETLDEKCEVSGRTLRLRNERSPEEYRVFVIPGSKTIHWSSLRKIQSFYDAGGTVIATTQLPFRSAELGKDAEVLRAVKGIFGVDPLEKSYPVVTASSEWRAGGFGAERATDGDVETRWNAADGTASGEWLEVDFGGLRTVTGTTVREAFDRTTSYAIERWTGSEWKDCVAGGSIGAEKTDSFPPVETSRIRLLLKSISSDSASIRELEVHDDRGENLARRASRYTRNGNVAGGKAFFAPAPSAAVLREMLDEAYPVYDVELEEDVAVEGGNLSCIHKKIEGAEVYFFANSSDDDVAVPVRLRGKLAPKLWDPHTGEIRECPHEHVEEAGEVATRIELRLPPVRSVFVVSAGEPDASKESVGPPKAGSGRERADGALPAPPPGFRIRLDTVRSGFDQKTCWVHARAGVVPPSGDRARPAVVMTMQQLLLTGSDVFYALNEMRTEDLGKTWSGPTPHETTLGRRDEAGEIVVAACDFTPKWHEASGKLLGIGQTVRYRNNKVMAVRARETAYAVYDPEARVWTPWRTLEMPAEERFRNAGAGSVQRWDLPDGDILLPIYYKEPKATQYGATVLRCSFDGETLRYREHGSEHTVPVDRGLCEPSLTRFGGRYFLTLRNDEAGYVTSGSDGLHFAEPRKWRFDDGTELGNYNTQQHWVAHSSGLFLAYTRKGAGNDHVFRHRAPLFVARVDPETLRVIRRTERILVPERGARLGNFGVAEVDERETWVTVTEWMQTKGPNPHDFRIPMQYGSNNAVFVARILWDSPNEIVRPSASAE